MAGSDKDIQNLTKAVNGLDKSLVRFIRIAETLNANVVEIGRMMKEEKE